jgi:hypothetical protein
VAEGVSVLEDPSDANSQTVTCCNATFTDLALNHSYVFGVFAADDGGRGPNATSPVAVPGVGLPQPPPFVNVTAVIGAANSANVSWPPCPDDGGSPLLFYSCACANVTGAVVAVAKAPGASTSVVIAPLPINVSLSCVVVAHSARGGSAASPPSAAITLDAQAPQPPLNVFAYAVPVIPSPSTVCTQAAVVVEFMPSADHGGANVTAQSFVVSSVSPSGEVRVLQSVYWSPSQPVCVDNDVIQAYTVTEVNSFHIYGAASQQSAFVRANGGVQSPVTGVTVAPDTSVVGTFAVSWRFMGISGAAPVLYFSVMVFACSDVDTDYVTPVVTANASATARDITVVAGGRIGVLVPYCFVVTPVNAAGVGPWSSPPVSVSQNPTAPTPVDVTSAVGNNGSVVVEWAPAASSGGVPIVLYSLTLRSQEPGGALGPPSDIALLAQPDPTANYSHTLLGLTNGVVYLIAVAAVNNEGLTSACFPSDRTHDCIRVARPCTAPTAPAAPAVVGRDTTVEVTWRPPGDGGCELTNYTVYLRRLDDAAVAMRTREMPVGAGTRLTWTRLGFSEAYSVSVSARNSHGEGTPSPWSRRVVTSQAVIAVSWWQIAAGGGVMVAVCGSLFAADNPRCRQRLSRCCSRRAKSPSGGGDEVLSPSARIGDNYGAAGSDSALQLVPRRKSSAGRRRAPSDDCTGEMRQAGDGADTDAAAGADLHAVPTRYRTFIAVLLCVLRLVFSFGVTTYTYALDYFRRRFLWAQLAAVGTSFLIGFFTSYRFFTSLNETYKVLYGYKMRRSESMESADVRFATLAASATGSGGKVTVPAALDAVAPSYERWARETRCGTSPFRFLSAVKPAVLEVLVSRAFGAAPFCMPVTDMFRGWR